MSQRISCAQNGEDLRFWHAFGPRSGPAVDINGSRLTYVEVGANEPWKGSVTAALHDLGWSGLLVEADAEIADRLMALRPNDQTLVAAAGAANGEAVFYRVRGTGLGTLDPVEAHRAGSRGFLVEEVTVPVRPLDEILDNFLRGRPADEGEIHALSIDVEGAESAVLSGLSLSRHRPWVISIEAVQPGTADLTTAEWQQHLLSSNYRNVAFDGVNRWFVADERADIEVSRDAGAALGLTIAEAIALPFNVLDIGFHGWISDSGRIAQALRTQVDLRQAWQRELTLQQVKNEVSATEYEKRIVELDRALSLVEASRTLRWSRRAAATLRPVTSRLRRASSWMPNTVGTRLIRQRHLRHVTVNMGHLTNAAYLGNAPEDHVTWQADVNHKRTELAGQGMPLPPVPPGLEFAGLSEDRLQEVRAWIDSGPWDHDAQLDARMDNHGDEVGRTQAALRFRSGLAATATPESPSSLGRLVLFDARALQTPAFGARGIGRFAGAALQGLREALADRQLDLLIDPALYNLPDDIVGTCRLISTGSQIDPAIYGLFVQPSPMTASPAPLLPILASSVEKVALVYDFIPLHYPSVYLGGPAARSEYLASLDALAQYSRFVCISHTVAKELRQRMQQWETSIAADRVEVAWPRSINESLLGDFDAPGDGAMVVMTGDEPRKNTYGGLAAAAAATVDSEWRDVKVIGMAGQDDRVHHWSIAAAMRPGEVQTLPRVSDEEMVAVLQDAPCVIVPSFDEGLSLPVIEAVSAGIPVVASDIAAHRELIGTGGFLGDPASPRDLARAVRRTRSNVRTARRQRRRLVRHDHAVLEDVMADWARKVAIGQAEDRVESQESGSSLRGSPRRLRVALATPWWPQPSGVADFSTAVGGELARLCDLTVYTTADALPEVPGLESPVIAFESVETLLRDPRGATKQHDVVITVVGNSHFHLPFVQVAKALPCVVSAHDTRMVEFYMALRGPGGAEQVMMRTPRGPRVVSPPLDDQIDDMRLLQNAGMWEIARDSSLFISHSPGSASLLEAQTGVPVHVLPFANQRVPDSETVSTQDREAARARLGLAADRLHIATFGYVDVRTKMTDVILEAVGWLTAWGHDVELHVVGSASSEQEVALRNRAETWGLLDFSVTGFVDESTFRDWLLAIDVGVQLRVSPMLGVSGPLSDLAAFGTPAVASAGLCVDVGAPAFIRRIPDSTSPVEVAEAIEQLVTDPTSSAEREVQRRTYLESHTPLSYAQSLLGILSGELDGDWT